MIQTTAVSFETPSVAMPYIIKTSNEPKPPGTIDTIPKTEPVIYIARIVKKSVLIPIIKPINKKNPPANVHSKKELIIRASSRFNVRSAKNSVCLNFVAMNSTGKYTPPPTSQIQ